MFLYSEIHDLVKMHGISEASECLLYESINECSTTTEISKEMLNKAIEVIKMYELLESEPPIDELQKIFCKINT
ncbi:hypothetical protein [Vibrio parahaemolyticus]|uniref:hypothetical protein n=1 Tax=Vibrio parahaemolyticus TaxID=670 RepID=UPI0003C760F1|nr:hypothetical protein [Vibrio parahaemolyticus]